jgi:hypothetical protein
VGWDVYIMPWILPVLSACAEGIYPKNKKRNS